MSPLEIFIPGKPMGKGRPRFNRKTGNVYTDAKTVAKEREISALAQIAMIGRKPFLGAMSMQIDLYMKGERTTKVDGDNAAKLVMDALNGVVYGDDKQVVDLRVIKHGKSASEQTRVEVEAI